MMDDWFPRRLESLRTNRGLTKWGLAEKIGVSDVSIGYWERGKRVPSAENLAALARVFNCTMDYLWHGSKRQRTAHGH